MAELSQQEEQELIEALIAIDWTLEIDDESLQVIRERCRCSLNKEKCIMENLYGRNLIRYDSGVANYLRGSRHQHPSRNGKGQSSLLPAIAASSAQNGCRASCYGPSLAPMQRLSIRHVAWEQAILQAPWKPTGY